MNNNLRQIGANAYAAICELLENGDEDATRRLVSPFQSFRYARLIPPILQTGASAMSNQPNWKTEFPAFPLSDMPELPPGFVDISWHNDACPNFHNAALGLCVFVDYLNPAMRDYPDTERFTLYRVDENSVTAETILKIGRAHV